RAALGRGAVALGMAPGGAELSLRGGDGRAPLQLCVLPRAEAAAQLRALLFAMAASIEDLERQLGGACGGSLSWGQVELQRPFVWPHPSPRKIAGAGSAPSAKRKIPGESLINPGFKSKKAPSGVDFEDS
ncbi:PAXX protein, partial [Penelope pileata]|nr:PAXX protein [Penelope pileata]